MVCPCNENQIQKSWFCKRRTRLDRKPQSRPRRNPPSYRPKIHLPRLPHEQKILDHHPPNRRHRFWKTLRTDPPKLRAGREEKISQIPPIFSYKFLIDLGNFKKEDF